MSLKKITTAFALFAGLSGAAFALDAVREIAPTGALRVAVARPRSLDLLGDA